MIRLRKYNTDRDYQLLKSWYEMWAMRPPAPEEMSSFGVVAEGADGGIAAGFLLKTDTCTALLEGFISNPETWSFERDEALDHVSQHLIDAALIQGYKNIVCFTKLPAIAKRARKLGFKEIGDYKLLSRGVL
jgi:hypothetical protein